MWVSVKEDLPKDGETVLVRGGTFNYCPLFYSNGKFYTNEKSKCYDGNVTHWMHIPEFKKGE